MEFDQWVEWRVTGDPGHGYPPYDFVWSERHGHTDPEDGARRFAAAMVDWVDGPYLSRRTVREWPWRTVVDRVRPHGGRWPDPGPDARCARCTRRACTPAGSNSATRTSSDRRTSTSGELQGAIMVA